MASTLAQHADRWARVASLVVAVLGLVVVVVPAAPHLDFDDDPFTPATETKTVETVSPDGKKTVETTTGPAEPSLAERSLGPGGLLLLRLGVVALAAFLAGGVVQRSILARYDLKVGAIEIPAITKATDDAIATLTARMTRQEQATRAALLALATLTRTLAGESAPRPPAGGASPVSSES